MQVGDKVWKYDQNLRVYVDDNGVKHSGPIYRKSFRELTIVGETRVSWILGNKEKIKKSEVNTVKGFFTNKEELDKHCWVKENLYNILRKIEYCNDYETIKKIADLVGYEQA